jgi:ABC-type nitrate/sulfonate/bicarbonate transport system permease component
MSTATRATSTALAWWKHVAFAAVFFGVWEITGLLANPILWPPFHAVAAAFLDILTDGSLIAALRESLVLLVIGLGASWITGLVLGILLGRVRVIERMVLPFLGGLYATPVIALIPLLLVWFGFGLSGRAVIVWSIAFFPMLVNVYAGVRDTPDDLLEVARSFQVTSELALLRTVVLPSAVPMIMAGVRLSIGRGVVGMAVAEVYLRLGGIGELITDYGSVFRTDYVLASILSLPLLGMFLTGLAKRIESRFQSWRPTVLEHGGAGE